MANQAASGYTFRLVIVRDLFQKNSLNIKNITKKSQRAQSGKKRVLVYTRILASFETSGIQNILQSP